jgi:caa(3)-type oxidase subunit IV|tara:strand:- start:928 stop:1311 length:384 start_codon:yes stop_codon:yes gene_type:complete
MAGSIEEVKKAKKLFMFIGLLLFFFTIVTVMVASVEWLDFGGHGFDAVDATIGLAIATFKASLVMLIFMHLNHERPLIYLFFGLGILMAFFCMWLIGWSKSDPIQFGNPNSSDGFYNPDKPSTESHH